MSKYHILLDNLKLEKKVGDESNVAYPLSEYIKESEKLEKSSCLNNNPSLLKFNIIEKKDFDDTKNENKFRSIKDNVTDAFVNNFFINNIERLNMLIDYQYHFIYFNIMSKINNELMNNKYLNRNEQNLGKENLYPLEYYEHILLNFKGGSTMYYLYNNIINHLTKKKTTNFSNIKDNFKISDIDLSLLIETENSYRYYQLDAINSYLLTDILEDLTNRFEFIYLNTICDKISNDEYKNNEELKKKIKTIEKSLTNKKYESFDILNIEIKAKRVYDDIYYLKSKINICKEEKNEDKSFKLINKFIQIKGENKYILKSVDMLEITLITEFISFMTYTIPIENLKYTYIVKIFYKIKEYGKYLLNIKYEYLLNNLYKTKKTDLTDLTDLNNFLEEIPTSLKKLKESTLKKAIKVYEDQTTDNKTIKKKCNIVDGTTPDGKEYYKEHRFFTDYTGENKSVYNLIEDSQITDNNIKLVGKYNFFLHPQDSSKYPYVIVTTTNTGKNNKDIKDLKTLLHAFHTDGIDIIFPNGNKKLKFENTDNIHYLSINKSINMVNNKNNNHTSNFNLFRIKFNVVLENVIESINTNNTKCTSRPILVNTPSEFLDVGISSKDDSFHSISEEIEMNNKGIVFEIKYEAETIPEKFGDTSRILSYCVETFSADLNNVLYYQVQIPWLDFKYKKRLCRLFFYIFNVINIDYSKKQDKNQEESPFYILTNVFDNFFNNINYAEIKYENIKDTTITFINEGTNTEGSNTEGSNTEGSNTEGSNTEGSNTEGSNTIEEKIKNFIIQISKTDSDIFITTKTVKDLILSGRNLHNHLLLTKTYKLWDGFFSYTIIYLLLIKKFNEEIIMAQEEENKNEIIKEYSKIIQIFYNNSGITFNIKNYTNENEMNQSIVKNFINQFGIYIENIKEIIDSFKTMFDEDFDYNTYVKLPINLTPDPDPDLDPVPDLAPAAVAPLLDPFLDEILDEYPNSVAAAPHLDQHPVHAAAAVPLDPLLDEDQALNT
jgi:hypothetical protein